MASPVMSFEDFVEILRSEVPANITKANEKVEGELPDIFELKPDLRQRSLLLNPSEVRQEIKGLMDLRDKRDVFLDVVSAVRRERVEITEVTKGHREDERDFVLKGRNPETGVNVDDFRVLIGVPEKDGRDIRNEVTQSAFYKALNLHVYRSKAYLN
jgi:hypothetical protein